MPNGECNPCRQMVFISAMPSPSLYRSSVIRLALGVPAPARAMTFFMTQPLTPLRSSGLGGAFVSATSTSPLGRTYSQRGWSRSLANACTANPAAGDGFAPAGQPLAVATCMVGKSVWCGAGSVGWGPIPACTGNVAVSPQPPALNNNPANSKETARVVTRMGSLQSNSEGHVQGSRHRLDAAQR